MSDAADLCDEEMLTRLAAFDLSAAERVHGRLMAAEEASEIAELGRTYSAVHQFYKDRGFLPGLRTAYAVHNPALGDVAALIAASPPGR